MSESKGKSSAPLEEKVEAQMKGEAVELDHGDKTDQQKEVEEQAKEPVATPEQDVDELDTPIEGRKAAVDGLNPHLHDENDSPPVGGTLPPV